MRLVWPLVLVAACDARLGQHMNQVASDARAPDGAADARPCGGGDASMMEPGGTCLVLFDAPKIYVDAKAACAAIDAHLAFLKSAETDMAAETLAGTADTFAGATDLAMVGTWLWDDGTPMVYTNWETGEPNDGGGKYNENCLVIAASRPGKGWDDRPCDATQVPTSGSFPYICQF
ncbi:MAG TPA: lectin-like protein [Kofleriaceae bacterium]|nr:lectin-like protein [Kofleriaceae bacterium]